MLGGSSGINYMMYVRGSDADYDDWATLAGDKRWSSANMKTYMRKHQTLEPVPDNVTDRTNIPFEAVNHGTDGPVHTGFNDGRLPVEDAAILALDEACGFEKKPVDPWCGNHLGFFNTLSSVNRTGPHKGKRSYAARGYFEANRTRPNLKVLCQAVVTKVLLNAEKTATGVSFTHAGAGHEVRVKREVLVCAGAIQSPQILEISGIGDPKVLSAAGIPVEVDLPGVGNNFQDHDASMSMFSLQSGVASMDDFKDPETLQAAAAVLQQTQGGPLTNIQSAQGFLPYKSIVPAEELRETVASIRNTPTSDPFYKAQLEQIATHLESDQSANLQMVVLPVTGDFDSGIADQSLLFAKPPAPGTPGSIIFAALLSYPASRGSVHVRSSDPNVHPVLDPAYLAHPADVAVIAAALRMVERVVASPHLKPLVVGRSLPEKSVDLTDVEASRAFVREYVLGTYHPIGTCAMGAVVDGSLKVKGVKGLRIVDASVFPNHISGNICSSVYAVAENAADIIKSEYA
jgi:choline dehydrogenase-like flavoprotein